MDLMKILEDIAEEHAISEPKTEFVNYMLCYKLAKENINEEFDFASNCSKKLLLNEFMQRQVIL